jgi:two-component system OmpR family response regulator
VEASAKGGLVLLVEDDDDSREIMAEVLTVAGHRVRTAADGPAALRALSDDAVEVVITDLGLPGMGGLELARAVRVRAPGVPVVLVTGWPDHDEVERPRGRDVDAVLTKPVDPDRLVEVVAALVVSRGRPPA